MTFEKTEIGPCTWTLTAEHAPASPSLVMCVWCWAHPDKLNLVGTGTFDPAFGWNSNGSRCVFPALAGMNRPSMRRIRKICPAVR